MNNATYRKELAEARRTLKEKHDVRELFTGANPKTDKSTEFGYLTAILHLLPAQASGYQVCPMAELAACIQACLNTSGHGGISKKGKTWEPVEGWELPDNVVQRARMNRTLAFFESRQEFLKALIGEIQTVIKRAKRHGLKPAIRLNGTSDIRWEIVPVEHDGQLFRSIMDVFPDVQFYDYTKIPNRRNLPANYHLTWSYSEANKKYTAMMPDHLNVAVVFRKELPAKFKGRPVVNGDQHDLRFLDPDGAIVGLKAKGRGVHDQSGFVIDV